VPAYVVFSNRTLDELAARRPATSTELLAVPGIGPAFVELHGTAVLALVAERPG
jgi:superfamily II DNA helicase RecQ